MYVRLDPQCPKHQLSQTQDQTPRWPISPNQLQKIAQLNNYY